MPWYRIVPKTGNRKYLELPAGPINEHALANVKIISCWPTAQKPSKTMPSRYWQSWPVIFIKAPMAKKIDIYTTIKLIGEYFRKDPLFSIFEHSTGTYLRFQNLFDFRSDYFSATAVKKMFEKILVDTIRYTFAEVIPVMVFLELNNNLSSLSFYFNKKEILRDVNDPEQYLKQYVDAKRAPQLDNNLPVFLKYLIICNQTLLEKHRIHDDFSSHIHKAILRCRYFNGLYILSGDSFYLDNNIVNFCISLGSIGVSHLFQRIKATLEAVQARPCDDDTKTLCFRMQLTLEKVWEVTSNPKLIKPIRCSKKRFMCKSWCGALSPIELLLLKANHPSPGSRFDKLSSTAEEFIQQLPRDRILFRRAELQTSLPKSIRCTYNVDLSISHLIASGYIIKTKAFVRNFKPGKNTELYILNWQKIQKKIDDLIQLTSGLHVAPPPPSIEIEEFYSE